MIVLGNRSTTIDYCSWAVRVVRRGQFRLTFSVSLDSGKLVQSTDHKLQLKR